MGYSFAVAACFPGADTSCLQACLLKGNVCSGLLGCLMLCFFCLLNINVGRVAGLLNGRAAWSSESKGEMDLLSIAFKIFIFDSSSQKPLISAFFSF